MLADRLGFRVAPTWVGTYATLASMIWPPDPIVLYTRGQGCAELAELLSSQAARVAGDLAESCVRARADLLVTRRPPGGFDLVSVAVPIDFQPEEVGAVVAAVAGGRHSLLNAALAVALGRQLGVETMVATAYYAESARAEAEQVLDRIIAELPGLPRLLVGADDPAEFVRRMPERALLVLGEPGGSLLSRLFFGPGARLRARAPAGAVMVRYSPPRVFHRMTDPVFVGPLHQAADTLLLYDRPIMAVADGGILVGVVRRSALEAAPPDTPVSELMEPPLSVRWDQPLAEARDLMERLLTGPVPVTDPEARLVGTLATPIDVT